MHTSDDIKGLLGQEKKEGGGGGTLVPLFGGYTARKIVRKELPG